MRVGGEVGVDGASIRVGGGVGVLGDSSRVAGGLGAGGGGGEAGDDDEVEPVPAALNSEPRRRDVPVSRESSGASTDVVASGRAESSDIVLLRHRSGVGRARLCVSFRFEIGPVGAGRRGLGIRRLRHEADLHHGDVVAATPGELSLIHI